LRHRVLVINFESDASSQATVVAFDGSLISPGPPRSCEEMIKLGVVGVDVIACHMQV
jgi:hypothetical protein